MSDPCPHCGSTSPAFLALSKAVLELTAEQRSLERALQTMASVARRLADARYAAIGVPDDEGGFEKFVTSGISTRQAEAIGPLPRQHGLLGAMLKTKRSQRATDIQEDRRFAGWPEAHPKMRSFLGVPVISAGRVIGAFYLADKRGGPDAVFGDEDQRLIETLAAHAAVAIENARLFEQSRELSVMEERNRLARELHDAVSQTLFSASLKAEATVLLIESKPEEARRQLQTVQQLTRAAMEELRSLIFELRPADLDAEGLAPTLRKHIDVLRRVHETEIELLVEGERRLGKRVELAVFRIAQEALTNALKHASPEHLGVHLQMPNGVLRLEVADDGSGFDLRSRRPRQRLGLVSMRERAEAIGGRLEISSRLGAGTTVALEVELD